MAEMFVTLGSWNWLIFGVLLMALELLAPGVFAMFWLGLSAFLVGVLSFIVTPSWQVQILLFGLFALAAVPLWRRIARQKPGANPNPFLNKRSDALVGAYLHAGSTDHRRRGHRAHRRHSLARQWPGYAGRHAR